MHASAPHTSLSVNDREDKTTLQQRLTDLPRVDRGLTVHPRRHFGLQRLPQTDARVGQKVTLEQAICDPTRREVTETDIELPANATHPALE